MNRLYVVGLGPGEMGSMTINARDVILSCDVIVGYTAYTKIVEDNFSKEELSDKEIVSTGMRKETDRCRMALEIAEKGRTTAVVCSGDSGVYGMAGLIYELAQEYENVSVEIVPGVTAALSCGAILGAPLGHDFAVISLSDLLTPWEYIETRINKCSEADMAICLYNPSSHKRADYLMKACDIMLRSKEESTVCGYVRNAGRDGLEWGVITLDKLREFKADMFTTVFVGNKMTRIIDGKMITPRGYRI